MDAPEPLTAEERAEGEVVAATAASIFSVVVLVVCTVGIILANYFLTPV